jgi:hypothetical protein
MSATWRNVYWTHIGGIWNDPESPEIFESRKGVYEYWNGHRLMPCVGMQEAEASHAWFIAPGGKSECLYNKLTKKIALETAR